MLIILVIISINKYIIKKAFHYSKNYRTYLSVNSDSTDKKEDILTASMVTMALSSNTHFMYTPLTEKELAFLSSIPMKFIDIKLIMFQGKFEHSKLGKIIDYSKHNNKYACAYV